MKEFSLLFPNWSKLQKHLNSDCSPDSAGRGATWAGGAEWSSFPFNHLCSTTNRKQQQQWTSSLLLPLMDPEPLQTRGLQTGTGHHSTAVFVHSSQSDQSSSGWAANSPDVFASTGRLRAERSERLNLSRDAGLLPKGCQNQTSTRLRLCLTSSHKGGPFLPVLTAWSRGVLTFFLFFFFGCCFPTAVQQVAVEGSSTKPGIWAESGWRGEGAKDATLSGSCWGRGGRGMTERRRKSKFSCLGWGWLGGAVCIRGAAGTEACRNVKDGGWAGTGC